MRMLILALLLATLTSCNLSLGPVAERQTVWAQMGTSGKVVSDTKCEVLVSVDGKWVRTKTDIKGMVVIDEPTYEALLKKWKESK
jgi:hypothetical protein